MFTAVLYTNPKLHTCTECKIEFINKKLYTNSINLYGNRIQYLQSCKVSKHVGEKRNLRMKHTCNKGNIINIDPTTAKVSTDLELGRAYAYDETITMPIPNDLVSLVDNLYLTNSFLKLNDVNAIILIKKNNTF